MGQIISNWFKSWSNKKARILMVGLDSAGKTSILYKLKLNETVTTVPTVGFNVESIQYKNITFTMWDIGGQTQVRQLWKFYFDNTDAIIYVIDSNDLNRINESVKELHSMMNDDRLKDSKLLVFANKQDLPYAESPSSLSEKLKLDKLKQKSYFIQPCCAISGKGLKEGLDWLANKL